jgi:mono/diheme cytochrome c family protein
MRTILACAAVLFASGSFVAGQQAPPAPATQKPRIEREAIRPTGTVDGKDLFTNYCAACHGTGAKGDGPAAAALNKKPADLTKISARNGGTFPATKVSRFIEGADEVPAHGNRDMPVWGSLFKSLNTNNGPAEAQLRVNNLTEYLKSIQQ